MHLTQRILSDINIFNKYARFRPDLGRRETWEEIVERNKQMHVEKFPALKEEIETAYQFVLERKVLPSMRSLQFAGRPIELNNSRLYNCSFFPVDDTDAFSELMFLLLSGCGVGYSVQRKHVKKLPAVQKPHKSRRYLVGDSIEGWADSVKVLMSAYMKGKPLPIYDFRDVREKGMPLLTAGGKAPGPEPLKDCLHNIQKVLDRKQNGERLTTLEVHDICCFIADAVLSGGIRRSAMIALFDLDDDDMLTCKFADWYVLNPQRARANNSAVIIRHKIEKDVFKELWEKIQRSNSGEPGIFFSNDADWGLNPCGEVSLRAFQFCNLVSINTVGVEDQEELNARARAASFIATLQASYTDFHYLRDIWKETTEKEALIGVSLAGIASGKVLSLDLTEAAKTVTSENERVAKIIGIKKAARSTVVKPDGNTSVVLGCSSGIHAWHSQYYIRTMRINKSETLYKFLAKNHPELIEDEFFKPHLQAVISVPQKAPDGAITRNESALDLLNRVSDVYNRWIIPGHRRGSNHNNVSTTVTIKDNEWEGVGEWMWKHRNEFTALSVLPYDGHTYVQAPFQEITKKEYEARVKTLHELDLTRVKEDDDTTELQDNLACAGGSCEI